MAARALVAARIVVTSEAAQPLHLLFQQLSCCKGLSVGVPHKGHHLLIGVSFHSSKFLIHAAINSSKLHMGIKLRDIGQGLPLFHLQQCRQPLEPEVFLDGIEDLFVEVLLHGPFTTASSRQPLKVVHICIEILDFLGCRIGAHQLHGSRFGPQITFWWWLPLASADGMFMFTLVHCCGMQKPSVATGIHSKGCWVATTSALGGKHWHPTAILPPLLKHFWFLSASWQQCFLLFCWHIGD